MNSLFYWVLWAAAYLLSYNIYMLLSIILITTYVLLSIIVINIHVLWSIILITSYVLLSIIITIIYQNFVTIFIYHLYIIIH